MNHYTDPYISRLERLYTLKIAQMEQAEQTGSTLRHLVLSAEAAALGAAIQSRLEGK